MPLLCSDPTRMALTRGRGRGRWTCVALKKSETWKACRGPGMVQYEEDPPVPVPWRSLRGQRNLELLRGCRLGFEYAKKRAECGF